MAETHPKRLREENSVTESVDSVPNSKRQKPYTNILDLLEDEEPSHESTHELSHDLSAILTTLQQELSSPIDSTFDFESFPSTAAEVSSHLNASAAGDGGDESVESVIRHLLEASDDELGIPNSGKNEEGFKIGDNFPFGLEDNGLWEIEDEAANYYTVLQAELFM